MTLRCLIVDDSAVFLRTARALLEIGDIAVTVAGTSDEARRRIDEVDPDVVLIDIDLGDENGFDLVAQLAGRTRRGGGALKTILISSHSREDFADMIADSSAEGFLPKSAMSAAAIRLIIGERA
jgi:two-component system, NarL family, nitrate/nitrite response regulator NarL